MANLRLSRLVLYDKWPGVPAPHAVYPTRTKGCGTAGKGWDNADAAGVAAMKADGVKIITASSSLIGEIKAKTGAIEGKWISAAKSKGVDGAKIMSDLRAEIAAASK